MTYLFLLISSFLLNACVTSDPLENENNALPIAPPILTYTAPLGKNSNNDKVVIKSMTSDSEYSIELPGGPTDYDLEVPLAQIGKKDGKKLKSADGPGNPVGTDRELLASMPRLEDGHANDTATLDAALGVTPENGPTQSPSYTMGIAKANDYYRRQEFEFALIEVNNLLVYFPQSAKLHLMKGTIYLKMQNLNMAEKSWQKAYDLNPTPSVENGLKRLRTRLKK